MSIRVEQTIEPEVLITNLEVHGWKWDTRIRKDSYFKVSDLAIQHAYTPLWIVLIKSVYGTSNYQQLVDDWLYGHVVMHSEKYPEITQLFTSYGANPIMIRLALSAGRL